MMRILITGTHSGCGKTTVTCAVLQALVQRGMKIASMKCGPDYIDPMFHRHVIGVYAQNLDGFFSSAIELRRQVHRAEAEQLCVLEGAMGFYDGIGATAQASSYEIARQTETPAVLVVDCQGMSNSIGAILQGFRDYLPDHTLQAVIFNRLSAGLYEEMAKKALQAGLKPLGYLPKQEAFTLKSRHLGLVTAAEVADLKQRLEALACQAAKTIDLDGLLQLAAEAAPLLVLEKGADLPYFRQRLRIAVARDAAFCFYYQENLDILERMGCQLCFFSPLQDTHLPENCSGLWLGGGYPELWAQDLSANHPLRQQLYQVISSGLPTIAECGGFLYLHQWLETKEGLRFPMVGLFPGVAYPAGGLRRFGYVTLKAQQDTMLCAQGESFPSHEFHYWESPDCGNHFMALKASGQQQWPCVHSTESLYAGFPHVYLQANLQMAVKFVKKVATYGAKIDRTDPED